MDPRIKLSSAQMKALLERHLERAGDPGVTGSGPTGFNGPDVSHTDISALTSPGGGGGGLSPFPSSPPMAPGPSINALPPGGAPPPQMGGPMAGSPAPMMGGPLPPPAGGPDLATATPPGGGGMAPLIAKGEELFNTLMTGKGGLSNYWESLFRSNPMAKQFKDPELYFISLFVQKNQNPEAFAKMFPEEDKVLSAIMSGTAAPVSAGSLADVPMPGGFNPSDHFLSLIGAKNGPSRSGKW